MQEILSTNTMYPKAIYKNLFFGENMGDEVDLKMDLKQVISYMI